jgi:DNA-binding response OmpR family regulator
MPVYYYAVQDDVIRQTGEPAGAALSDQTHGHYRILVVDDDTPNRWLHVDLLNKVGYYAFGAEDGAAGWNALQVYDCNLIITDNRMPKMTGVEMIAKVHAAGIDLPVIMATGVLPREFTQFPWLKPAALLLKPYTLAELLGTVKKVLRPA